MRYLSEYKAEIFRRSEEKIKERKRNRNRTFAFCIPLCLVIAAVAFAKLPNISASNITDENISSDSDAMLILVEVQNSENKLQSSIVNAEDVSDVYLMIQSSFETAVQADDMADDHRYVTTSQTVVQDSLSLFSDTKYKILFTVKDGETFSYTLDGNKLIDNTTNEKVTLSSEQAFELQSKLGLIITWEEER